jgi:hypothetical protein
MAEQFIIVDSIKWWISENASGVRFSQPICPIHNLRLYPVEDIHSTEINYDRRSKSLKCEECEKVYSIPRGFLMEKQYVINKIDAMIFKGMRFINLDDQALPIAKEEIKSGDSKYFVTSLLTESKTGLRLVVYAGKRGSDKKTQIFVEPEIKRLAFDQKDLHPTDVFTELEATFADGGKHKMVK